MSVSCTPGHLIGLLLCYCSLSILSSMDYNSKVRAEHLITTSHCINFDDTIKLGTATKYMDCLVKEAIEIWLHPDNFNRDDRFNLSHTWCPIIKMLQLPRSAPTAKQGQAQVANQPRPPANRLGLYL